MRGVRHFAMISALAIVIAACSSDDAGPLTLEEYVEQVTEAEQSFEKKAQDLGPDEGDDPGQTSPDEQLVSATVLFDLYESRTSALKGLTPPPELAERQAELVASLQAMQDDIAMYLSESGMSGEDFDFQSIGAHPTLVSRIRNAESACRQFRRAITDLGLVVEMANDCRM